MNEELKPCPFCEKSDKVTIYTESMAQYGKLLWIRYGVKCKRCHFGIPTYAKKTAALHKWNTRPVEYRKDREIERLKELFSKIREVTSYRYMDLATYQQKIHEIGNYCKIAIGKDTNDTDNNSGSMEKEQ